VAEIFAAEGEAAFRAAETEALRRAVAGTAPVVVSVAGGAVLSAGNRSLLRDSGTVVWLRARPSTLADRVGDGEGRPLLAGDAAAVLETLSAARHPLYEEVAAAIIDVDDLAIDELASQLVGLVAGAGEQP
jgi:shikimate kinase